ncbi:MAG: alcohol dehydrogenase catalytic domain-containing protein, partial [Actinomycetota bacterium]
MKAVVVTPGQKGSGRVQEVPTPEPKEDEALVEVIEVGVCGTDLEILSGLYGQAPPGDDYLIIGHENFGRVVKAPEGGDVKEGDLAVCIVRRPDPVPCPQCAAGE